MKFLSAASMADSARSEEFLEAEMKNLLSHPLGVREAAIGTKQDDDREQEMRRRLFERFMASCGPGRPYLYAIRKVHTHPCVLYTMKVSVKTARASWSHRSSRRLFPERRGMTFPIPLCRAVGPDGEVEPVVDRSGAPAEPDRPGIVSGISDHAYYSLEFSREMSVLRKEGSMVPWTEVAVIRSMPRGRGITVTAHVKSLVVRLHDILFLLPGPSATVDLRFSEQWFQLPSRWTEERLYAKEGFPIIDIGVSVENLVKKLCLMREQEDAEMEKLRFETEEDREIRLQREEVARQQEEEEKRKIRERKREGRRRKEAEAAATPRAPPMLWDAALWLINDDAHPAAVRRYSKFKLSMDRTGKVSCNCVEQEGLQEMRGRANMGYVFPVSKTTPGLAPPRALETLGSVEGYRDEGTMEIGPNRGLFVDESGRTLSSVLMVSKSAAEVLTIEFLVHKLDILLDDGMVMSGHYNASVDIHCDDISSSELLKADWAYRILCKNTDIEGRVSFSALLVQLKKKLKLHLTKQEWALYNLTVVDANEDNEDLFEQLRKEQNWVPPKPKHDLEEIELHDCSILFPTPCESYV